MTFEEDNQDSVSKLIEKLDSSLRFWERFLHSVGLSSGLDMYDFGRPMQSSPIAITEMDASSGDSDKNVLQNSPSFYTSSPHSGEICSSFELAAASSDHAESPLISIFLSRVRI